MPQPIVVEVDIEVEIGVEEKDLKASGIFKQGKQDLRSTKPLIVLIHGGGSNATYFDNSIHSLPKIYTSLGHDVLNVNRPGYGGNPLPTTSTPLLDSLALLTHLIKNAYTTQSSGKNGIILIGHSLGAAISLSLAAFHGNDLPLLGVSAMGIIPTNEHPQGLIEILQANPENPRFVVEPTPENTEAFMGPPEVVDVEVLTSPEMLTIFEPGLKSEMLEWFDPIWFERFVNDVAPNVSVPVQYLAAEYELQWKGIEAGQPIFDYAAGLFKNAPRMDARILLGGGHDFEFSKNASVLQDARNSFVKSLV